MPKTHGGSTSHHYMTGRDSLCLSDSPSLDSLVTWPAHWCRWLHRFRRLQQHPCTVLFAAMLGGAGNGARDRV